MTDHPTRRLPENERPDRHPPAQPTHRLDRPLPPDAPQEQCGRCGGPVECFQLYVQTAQGLGLLEIQNPAGPRESWHGRVPHAPTEAWVCLDCGYTELYTRNPRSLRQG